MCEGLLFFQKLHVSFLSRAPASFFKVSSSKGFILGIHDLNSWFIYQSDQPQ